MEDTGLAMKSGRLQRLKCSVMSYDWGRPGGDSQVARLFALNYGSKFEPEKPYVELWMGTHDSGPSFLVSAVQNGALIGSETVTLKSWLSKNPNVLGEKVLERWGGDLPFLFKVISVAKALSIQAHPDKELARTLHKLQPDVYKDGNHKPDMALAITEFEALCGFISLGIDRKSQLSKFKMVKKKLGKKLGHEEAKELVSKFVYIFSVGANDYAIPLLINSSIKYPQEEFVDIVIDNITTVLKVSKKGK